MYVRICMRMAYVSFCRLGCTEFVIWFAEASKTERKNEFSSFKKFCRFVITNLIFTPSFWSTYLRLWKWKVKILTNYNGGNKCYNLEDQNYLKFYIYVSIYTPYQDKLKIFLLNLFWKLYVYFLVLLYKIKNRLINWFLLA